MERIERALLMVILAGSGCAGPPLDDESHPHEETGAGPWAVTAWGERFEIFPETGPLVAGEPAISHTHVTRLRDFSPLRQGRAAIVLRGSDGREQSFESETPIRDGIYSIAITPAGEGEFELLFRIVTAEASEEIPGGHVRVGNHDDPGGLIRGPRDAPDAAGGEQVSFLKEQQWKTPFATAWVREGALQASVTGPGRVRTQAGGERIITAPVDAVVAADHWPYPGLERATGSSIFRLIPTVSRQQSLAELGARATALEAERGAAASRLGRLEELLRLEAVSRAEVEALGAELTALEAGLAAARTDLEAARASRDGVGATRGIDVVAPWPGVVAQVAVSPGQAVVAGQTLGRLVKPEPLWIEVALPPEDATRVRGEIGGVWLRHGAEPPVLVPAERARLVSRAPELDPRTARVTVLVEVGLSAATLPIGSGVEAKILLGGEHRGIVVPVSALIDDSGATVVYLQVEGEAFARQPVEVVARQGDRARVLGLSEGARLVTEGGAAIRRASLLATGAPEGHVH